MYMGRKGQAEPRVELNQCSMEEMVGRRGQRWNLSSEVLRGRVQ